MSCLLRDHRRLASHVQEQLRTVIREKQEVLETLGNARVRPALGAYFMPARLFLHVCFLCLLSNDLSLPCPAVQPF